MNNPGGINLITLPISSEALVRTEIWTNDPNSSSEAYVTMKPCCVDNCLQNVHFVDSSGIGVGGGSSDAGNDISMSPSAQVAGGGCIFALHPGVSSDLYALTSDTTTSPSISIIDPISGNRIFVPPFTTSNMTVSQPSQENVTASKAHSERLPPEPEGEEEQEDRCKADEKAA